MLPAWLYSKSKKKLIEELGGGGGGGTTYTAGDGIDISSGVISFDPSTMDAIPQSKVTNLGDDLADLAPKTAISNPNILHNPWFTVNQRGFTTTTSNSQFPADRWTVYGNTPAYTLTRNSDGTITVDNSNGTENVMFRQKRTTTYLNSLNGMKLTASVMFSDGTIITGTKVASSTAYTQYINNEQMEVATWPAMGAALSLLIKPGASVTIRALKLEVGEISTLHLDPRPEYAIELAKCLRYFQRYVYTDAYPFALGMAISATTVRVPFKLKSDMRTTPTISTSPISDIVVTTATTGSGTSPSALTSHKVENGEVCLQLEGSGYTVGAPYFLAVKTGSANVIFDFSAEL